jgi:hypothetical protein
LLLKLQNLIYPSAWNLQVQTLALDTILVAGL